MPTSSRTWSRPRSTSSSTRPRTRTARGIQAFRTRDSAISFGSAEWLASSSPAVDTDGYSGFEGTGLEQLLHARGITQVTVVGLATDYCVKNTALAARREGFDVTVVEDAVRGVDVAPGDSARALEEMKDAGARLATSDEILAERS